MKFLISVLSLSLLSTILLGPVYAGGAQLLSDDDLDQVTAAGTSWSVDILPTNLVLGNLPTPNPVNVPTPLNSAFESVNAAAASAEAARAVSGLAGLAGASSALSTTATALTDASHSVGLDSLKAGKATLSAAATLLDNVPLEQVTPAIVEAANKVNQAAVSLDQAALQAKVSELTSAFNAVQEASKAINGLSDLGAKIDEIDHGAAIDEAVKSINVAKDAIDTASKAQAVSGGSPQTLVLKENGDGTLDPVLRINFNSGRTIGSADIIPLVTRGGPSQPDLELDGAALVNGTLPLTLIAETLMLNLNICFHCIADKIIQNNNGYIVPIYAQ